jgi:hypothetical protein
MISILTLAVIFLRLPAFAIEGTLSLGVAGAVRFGLVRACRLARYLPFLHHDLIFLPLPGLRSFLLRLADEDFPLAQQVLAEALDSVGQARPARLALVELCVRGLERAARERLFVSAAEMDIPLVLSARLPVGPLLAIAAAAQDLQAARVSGSHFHRRNALQRAAKILQEEHTARAASRRLRAKERRLLSTLRLWRDVTSDELAQLAREERDRPQVPLPFVAGPALRPADRQLFKGRQDLIRLIDHDLTGTRREPLVLLGQRRMGKSSLLNMLPTQLGTGTRVVVANFQGLSGSLHRDAPHRWVAALVAEACRGLPVPPSSGPWGVTLSWLGELEVSLERTDQRLLIAIDEAERLEDGVRQGWANTDLLDLVRAAGDRLQRIRFLLATAYPLRRLGPHWVDRLISALLRELHPLGEPAARELISAPIPDFPDIYPPGGVERILEETGRHPYLIQLTCDHLCRLLNAEGRLKAEPEDLDRAFDEATRETALFDELWQQRTDSEQAALRSLARGGGSQRLDPEAVQNLIREGYLLREDGSVRFAVPLFAAWITENA